MTSVTDIQYENVGLLSTPRLAALLGSVVVALCSGTNYVCPIQLSSVYFNPNTR